VYDGQQGRPEHQTGFSPPDSGVSLFCLKTEILDQSPQISPVSANFKMERRD
jgi:hypothetical protein